MQQTVLPGADRQNAHLTQKHNRSRGRHGWLRLTPAYSVKLVEDLVAQRTQRCRILDPFSGTATTTLCATMHGHDAVSLDINPFLEWFGNAKLAAYTPQQLATVREATERIVDRVRSRKGEVAEPPPLHKIERWWGSTALDALCRTKSELDHLDGIDQQARDLLMIAFCRTAIDTSNASFGHQSMSFKSSKNLTLIEDTGPSVTQVFQSVVASITDTIVPNPTGAGKVVHCDSRTLEALAAEDPFDLVLTSPPYSNRMSYIRELRPYMYWTGFLTEARQAGELDWDAIGGTWGIATSRLNDWSRDKTIALPGALEDSVSRIAESGEKNGPLLATYVARYFEDTARHLSALYKHVADGGELHYIVGNSKFYGELVQVQEVYAELMKQAGFRGLEIHTIRKRNSKKELYEYDVIARKR